MRKLLILSTALTGVAFAAHADVTVMSWGGAYGEAQTEAHVKPFTAKTGIAAVMLDSDNPATPIKAMVEAGDVTIDVASVEYADAIRLCDEGLLEPIDINALPAGAPVRHTQRLGGTATAGGANRGGRRHAGWRPRVRHPPRPRRVQWWRNC